MPVDGQPMPHESAARHTRRPHLHFPHIRFTRRELHDRPLAGEPLHRLHPKLYACEAAATAVLMVLGIAAVTLLTAPGSPLARRLVAHPSWQTALCGLLFGSAGTVAAMTPFGRVSGAHLSPSVSLAFSLAGRLAWPDLLGYVAAQLVGAIGGTALVWAVVHPFASLSGPVRAVHYAATYPAAGGWPQAGCWRSSWWRRPDLCSRWPGELRTSGCICSPHGSAGCISSP